jgi:heptosyltransferase-1
MRILIVKLTSFGDVIHTFPALTDLKAARPEIEVDWLVEEAYAALVRRHPGVAAVHEVALRRLRWPPTRWSALIRHGGQVRAAIRARRYDMVFDVQGLIKSALLSRLASAPVVGFDRQTCREPAAARFYHKHLHLGGHPHAAEQLRRFFAEAVGYPLPKGRGRAGLPRPAGRPAMPLPERYGLIIHGTAWRTKLAGRALAEPDLSPGHGRPRRRAAVGKRRRASARHPADGGNGRRVAAFPQA